MNLTNEQIKFLDKVCYGVMVNGNRWTLNSDGEIDVTGWVNMMGMNLTEIPVKFGTINGNFHCSNNNLTTLKNIPRQIKKGMGGAYHHTFMFSKNPLTDYFKSIKEEDFPYWENLYWDEVLREYPFLINIAKNHLDLKK